MTRDMDTLERIWWGCMNIGSMHNFPTIIRRGSIIMFPIFLGWFALWVCIAFPFMMLDMVAQLIGGIWNDD